MSAHDQMSVLLNSLMGPNRNDTVRRKPAYLTDAVCHNFLAGFCPNELLVSTRRDIGACQQLHADTIREEYRKSKHNMKLGYEQDLFLCVAKLLRENYDGVQVTKKRVLLEQESSEKLERVDAEEKAELARIGEEIAQHMAAADTAANNGDIAGVDKHFDAAEMLQKRQEAIKETRLQRKELRDGRRFIICEVCNVKLSAMDANQDEMHFEGRIHLAYLQMREVAEELRQRIDKVDPDWMKIEWRVYQRSIGCAPMERERSRSPHKSGDRSRKLEQSSRSASGRGDEKEKKRRRSRSRSRSRENRRSRSPLHEKRDSNREKEYRERRNR